MTENQKLREALQAISHIDDATSHSADASAALDHIGQIARQALALPTPAEPVEGPADGWLQDKGLLYRLTDDRNPKNRDEINVTMADGSRSDASRTRRAGELLDRIRSIKAEPSVGCPFIGKQHDHIKRTQQRAWPAIAELPEPELGYVKTDKSNQPAYSARQMRALKD